MSLAPKAERSEESHAPDHPQYAMWNTRWQAEQVAERERAVRRMQREAVQADWEKVWEMYKARRREDVAVRRRSLWSRVRSWLGLLIGLRRR